MLIKKIVAGLLLGGLVPGVAYGISDVTAVSSNAKGQARDMIALYRNKANSRDQKERYERDLREFLANLKYQSSIYGAAMDDEAMSGEIFASSINANEQVELDAASVLVEKELAKIDKEASKREKRENRVNRNKR